MQVCISTPSRTDIPVMQFADILFYRCMVIFNDCALVDIAENVLCIANLRALGRDIFLLMLCYKTGWSLNFKNPTKSIKSDFFLIKKNNWESKINESTCRLFRLLYETDVLFLTRVANFLLIFCLMIIKIILILKRVIYLWNCN